MAVSGPVLKEEGMCVVVADDNVDGATTLAALLQTLGCQAVAVYDGAHALAAALALAPRLVFLDLDMPGLGGAEVARELRAVRSDDLYLVCMTGREMTPEEAANVLAAGFDVMLIKPLDLHQVTGVLAACGADPGAAAAQAR